ncbi:unnamed protein product [Cylicocyclus nassatus]|uniref:Uncharacterized protein n=1 Tax=Cylicocyclus nassatus TaxID=53992 RepID=A0AA36HDP7_CYLNA|nr:unnamed protein product [Cylicocyclus nassatus]
MYLKTFVLGNLDQIDERDYTATKRVIKRLYVSSTTDTELLADDVKAIESRFLEHLNSYCSGFDSTFVSALLDDVLPRVTPCDEVFVEREGMNLLLHMVIVLVACVVHVLLDSCVLAEVFRVQCKDFLLLSGLKIGRLTAN